MLCAAPTSGVFGATSWHSRSSQKGRLSITSVNAFPLAIIAMTNVISKWLNGCIMGSSVSLSLVQFSPACGAVFIVVASFSISLRRTA